MKLAPQVSLCTSSHITLHTFIDISKQSIHTIGIYVMRIKFSANSL